MPNQHPQLPCTSARPPYLLSQQATSISSSPPPSCCARFCGLPGIPLLRPGCVSRVDMVLRGAALCRPMRKVLLLLLPRAVSGSGDRICRHCSNPKLALHRSPEHLGAARSLLINGAKLAECLESAVSATAQWLCCGCAGFGGRRLHQAQATNLGSPFTRPTERPFLPANIALAHECALGCRRFCAALPVD